MSGTAGETTENGAPQQETQFAPCPYCGEQIRADAVTCRFCKRDLHDPNAPRLVLDESTWNTQVPEWMREVERKALARRLLIRKIRRNSWKIVAAILAPIVLVILWRVTHMPPDPHEEAWREAALRGRRKPANVTPVAPVPIVATAPTPKPVLTTPTPAPTETLRPEASATPFVEASPAEVATPTPTEQKTSSTDTASVIGASASSLPAYDLHAEDLSREFVEARQIAEDKYVGETLRVTGLVRSIDRTGNVPTFLVGNEKPFVKCLLATGDKKTLALLRPNMQVAVHGRCDGAFVEVLLSDCTIE